MLFPLPRVEPSKLLLEFGGDVAGDGSLGELILLSKPFQNSRRERDMSHSQLLANFVEFFLNTGPHFYSVDDSYRHRGFLKKLLFKRACRFFPAQ